MFSRICLIVPTFGRYAEVERLFVSLERQTCKDFQVVLVDQNLDDRLTPLCTKFQEKLNILYVKDKGRGASRARNIGFEYSNAEIILWPDDDCWYPPDLIENVNYCFSTHSEMVGIIGKLLDKNRQPHSRWFPKKERIAKLMDTFTFAAEPVLAFQRLAFSQLGGFDPSLGTGSQSPWAAGEGTDLCVRTLKHGMTMYIEPSVIVFHEKLDVKGGDDLQIEKAQHYARGMGAVLKKNALPFPFLIQYAFTYLRALCWNVIKLNKTHVALHKERLSGLFEGYKNYK